MIPRFKIYKANQFGLGMFFDYGQNIFGNKIVGSNIILLFIEIYIGIEIER